MGVRAVFGHSWSRMAEEKHVDAQKTLERNEEEFNGEKEEG